MNSPRVIVTGATGFIGKSLVSRLRLEKFDVLSMSTQTGDIAEEATWRVLPRADLVIHLAGLSFVPDSWTQSTDYFRINFLGSICALEYCRKNQSKFIYMSSYLYGNPSSLPIAETAPLFATNPYALSKKMTEEACKFYSDNHDVKIVILRPFNVYGTGQDIAFLIPSIIGQAIEGKKIQVKDLEPRRDYVFVDDLVESILRSAQVDLRFCIMNIGTGKSHSVSELIGVVQAALGSRLEIDSSDQRRPGEVMDTIAKITSAKEILGWQPEWTLERGIGKMVADIRASLK